MSMNRWMYGYGNPINLTDPTGHKPLGLGYVEGLSVSIANDFSTTFGLVDGTISGAEIVYDYATMTRARFAYTGEVTGAITGVSAAIYAGVINGFGYKLGDVQSAQINDDYKGTFVGGYGGIGIRGVGVTPGPGLMVGVGYFQNPEGTLKGEFAYGSAGVGLLPVEGMGFRTNYLIDRYSLPGNKNGVEFYADESGHVNRGKLISDILSGDHSPSGFAGNIGATRMGQISFALLAAELFEDYHDYYLNTSACYPPKQPVEIPNPFRIPAPEEWLK